MTRPSARRLANLVVNEVEGRLQLPVLRSLPEVVDVVLSKACNLACTFCKDYRTPGAQRVTVQQFERVAAQLFPTAWRLNVCSGGEPYLHPGLEDLLRIARAHGLATWVLSNGTLCTEERLRTVVREGLVTEHGFSVDGIRAPTVEAIRVGARLEVVLGAVDQLLHLRAEEGRGPRIVIRYALMRSNAEELPEAVRYWGERGVEVLDCGYLSLANGVPRQESLYYHQGLLEEVLERARAAARGYPRLRLRLPPLVREEAGREASPTPCRAPWRFVMIDTNGDVLPCYRAFEALRLGNVHGPPDVPFRALWNGPGYQALRRTVNRDGTERAYAYCGVCELRHGWGREEAHLGDHTWAAAVADRLEGPVQHERPARALKRATPASTAPAARWGRSRPGRRGSR